jgi:hypothetical protein
MLCPRLVHKGSAKGGADDVATAILLGSPVNLGLQGESAALLLRTVDAGEKISGTSTFDCDS